MRSPPPDQYIRLLSFIFLVFCSTFGVCDPCQAGLNCLKVPRNNPEIKCTRGLTMAPVLRPHVTSEEV